MVRIHKSKLVEQILKFYGTDLLINFKEVPLVKEYLLALAKRMYEGVQANHSFIFREINNYHQDYLGKPIDELQKMNWTLSDCQQTIANEYGFKNWDAIPDDLEYDKDFEVAVDYLLIAQFDYLKKCIEKNPELLHRKSRFGHQATLLHYVGSNGVEMWRQVVPFNLVQMTKYLIEQGADKDAKMKVYGGEFSVLPLLETSAHPRAAGVIDEMKAVLK